MKNEQRISSLLAACALCTAPFLFGADGKGCNLPVAPDGGTADAGEVQADGGAVTRDAGGDDAAEDAASPGSDAAASEDASEDAATEASASDDASLASDASVANDASPGPDGAVISDASALSDASTIEDAAGHDCVIAADCHGALPQICVATCNGGPGACAHFECRAGVCETVICP